MRIRLFGKLINIPGIVLVISGIIVVIAGIFIGRNLVSAGEEVTMEEMTPQIQIREENTPEPSPDPPAVVYIVGAVVCPGVYEMDRNGTLMDLVNAAGGALPEADVERVNMASRISDGMMVRIPFVTDQDKEYIVDPGLSEGFVSEGKININTAGAEALMKLPGIGEVTANKIVAYRKKNGNFKKIEDIMNVSGIGTSKFEAIRDLIVV